MVKLNGQVVPETEDEYEMLKGLYEVTGEAQRNNVPQEDIVLTLMFVGSSLTAYGDEHLAETAAEPEAVDKRSTCPECGGDIGDVTASIGGEATVEPCGCNVTVHQVPGWFDV